MKLLDNYLESLNAIYEHFGNTTWGYSISDARKYWWKINNFTVLFYDSLEAYQTNDSDHEYSGTIQSIQKNLLIFESNEFTMINMDVQVGFFGNESYIFDNAKKIRK